MWTPYGPPSGIPAPSLFHGCLRFMGHLEAYMPDRVTRQFGRVQDVPRQPISFMKGTRLAEKAGSYKKVYGHADEYWHQMTQHSYALEDLGHEAQIASQSTPAYDQWYARITHPRVHNPAHGQPEVFVGTMHTATQHRLQPLRQNFFSLQQQVDQDPNVPDYVRAAIHDMGRQAGTGGYPGVHPTPMQNWWGQPTRYPEERYTQPVQPDWSSYPGPSYADQPMNPGDEDSE